MTKRPDPETQVKACYATWSQSYYDEYYGGKAAHPPVHRELLKHLLREHRTRTLLDAGCGPASFLRDLSEEGMELYGFDLTPEMVTEGQRIFATKGLPPERIWEGSVLSPQSFRSPIPSAPAQFDATVCIGVLPHILPEHDQVVIENLRQAIRPGGMAVLEARNQFFSLFTLNRYSWQFFADELMRVGELKSRAGAQAEQLDQALHTLQRQFRMELPPIRQGKADEPGYDEVLSRTHNPLVLKAQFEAAGFTEVQLLFYHFHCLPPMLEKELPELFLRESLAMGDPTDWRGYFMASAFLLAGQRA